MFNAHFTTPNHQFINKLVFPWNVNKISVPELLEQPVFVTSYKEGIVRRPAANGHNVYYEEATAATPSQCMDTLQLAAKMCAD